MEKIAQYNIEMEAAIIGSCLIEPEALSLVPDIIRTAETFYDLKHQAVYRALINLRNTNQVVDILSVTQELSRTSKLTDVGGPYFVSSLTDRVTSTANIEYHSRIVQQLFLLREMSKLSLKVHNLCNEPAADPFEIEAIFSRNLERLTSQIGRTNIVAIDEAVTEVLIENKNALTQEEKPGIGYGLYNMDRRHRKQKGKLIVLAARPGMGKTAFMLHCAKHTALSLKKPVGIASLEMSAGELAGRLMSSEAQISSTMIHDRSLDHPKYLSLESGINRLVGAPIYIIKDAALDIHSLRAAVRHMKKKYKIEEFYLDYIQLMDGAKGGNREAEISHITRNLKKLAMEEEIPITALSQLNRSVELRPDKKPQLSDLRESGSIEQDADAVLFLFRPEYYGLEDDRTGLYMGQTFDGRHLQCKGLLEVDCAKNRGGSLFRAALSFYGETMTVVNHGELPVRQLSAITPNTNFENDRNNSSIHT